MSEKKKILLADDSADIRDFVKAVLEDEGFEVDVVTNGTDCLKRVAEVTPDLIITDVMMPGRSGFHAVDLLRKADPKYKYLPVLVISGSTNVDMIFQDCDIDGFIQKPFKSEELLKKVREILKI